jgi:hypothetical protein
VAFAAGCVEGGEEYGVVLVIVDIRRVTGAAGSAKGRA